MKNETIKGLGGFAVGTLTGMALSTIVITGTVYLGYLMPSSYCTEKNPHYQEELTDGEKEIIEKVKGYIGELYLK